VTGVPPGRPAPPDQAAVVLAEPGDAEVLSHLIAEAFFDLPPSRWLIPDPVARRQIFPGYFRIHVEHALTHGLVHTTSDRAAAALWLPVSASPAGPPPGYDAALAAATGPWVSRFRAFDAALDRHHPTATAHHHLALLAVRPGRQGQGTGTILLHAHHAALDRDGMPAYLEAASLRTCQFYLRHGYALRPNAPFYLPDSGPAIWPMWRDPRRRLAGR
jgi:GNAT superfamily N-acetyltransferase